MFKDCKKCGRSIPKDWPRCGECQALREKVATKQQLEGNAYRDKVALRHRVVAGIMRRRPKPVVGQLSVRRILEQKRLMDGRKAIRKAQHKLVAPALKEWMEGE